MFEDIIKKPKTPTLEQCNQCSNRLCQCRICRGKEQGNYQCDCAWQEGNLDCYNEFNSGKDWY